MTVHPGGFIGHDGRVAAAATWWSVGAGADLGGVIGALEAVVRAAGVADGPSGRVPKEPPSVRRFRSDTGGSAILLPAPLIGVVADNAGSAVLVVDPPDVDAALGLMEQLGAEAEQVALALPPVSALAFRSDRPSADAA